MKRGQPPARLIWAVTALAAGVLAALAQPPFGFLPGLLAYGGLMWLADNAATLRSAFWRGWLAGLAYFAIGCWWVAEAFYVDAATFGWMAPLAAGALAAGLALFWGAGLLIYRATRPAGMSRVLVFAGAFALCEYGRGHLLTGLPWNLPGETWPAGSPPSQGAALVGAYGLTWITIAIAAAPALLVPVWRDRRAWVAVAFAGLTLAGLSLYGALRPAVRGVTQQVRLIQPNQPELATYGEADFRRILGDYIALTAAPRAISGPITVVWPEGAIPSALDVYLAPDSETRAAVTAALQDGDTLLVGGYRVENAAGGPRYFNSLAAFQKRDGALVLEGVYDKRRLVPFGEYLPMKPLLHAIGFQQLVPVSDGFSAGPAAPPLNLTIGAVQPLICYEALFPGLASQGARAFHTRPALLVNVSTDAWFGPTSGPLQHLNQAAYRAIEAGIPMVRATPTGVSAIINAYGQTEMSLGLGRRGVMDGSVDADARSSTPYSRAGEIFFWAMIAVSSLLVILRWRARPRVA